MLVDSSLTTVRHVGESHEFAVILLEEALKNLFEGEFGVTRILLRDVVNGTMGFEELSNLTNIPPKSLHRMLSVKGNPTMENFSAINSAIAQWLDVELVVKASKEEDSRLEHLQSI